MSSAAHKESVISNKRAASPDRAPSPPPKRAKSGDQNLAPTKDEKPRSKSTATAVNSFRAARVTSLSMTDNDEYQLQEIRTDVESGKEHSLRNDEEIFIVDMDPSSQKAAHRNMTPLK